MRMSMKTINARQVMTLRLQLQGRHSRLDVEQDVFTWIPCRRAQVGTQIDVTVEQSHLVSPTPKHFDGQGVWANQFLD
jgi:hypothetical protein